MISYTLLCSNDHSFDAWFRGGDDFDMQVGKGLISCPMCADTSISKALMAPNVSTGRSKEKAAREVTNAMLQAKAVLEADKAAAETGKAAKPEDSKPDDSKPVDGEVLPALDNSPSSSAGGAAVPADAQPVAVAPMLKDAPAPVKAYVEAVRKLRSEVEASSEDVGKNFASEARKMHHGESEERAIRGEASLEDAAALDEEGIDVFMLPTLPEDGH